MAQRRPINQFLESLGQGSLLDHPAITGMPGQDQGRMLNALTNTRDTLGQMSQAGYDPDQELLERLARTYTKRGMGGQHTMDEKTLAAILESMRAKSGRPQPSPTPGPSPQQQPGGNLPHAPTNRFDDWLYSIPGAGEFQQGVWDRHYKRTGQGGPGYGN